MTRQRTAVVVGGGIIGTAVARELALAGSQVTVLEKEPQLAAHQSGHNSGVVHAGLYYEPGSLKAQLCRRGVSLLQEYAVAHEIAYDEVGKLVIALDRAEGERLTVIHERARANGVPGVRMLDAAEIAEVEPWAQGHSALHSPHTAIVDYPALTRSFAADVATAGGSVVLGTAVTGLREGRDGETLVDTARETYAADLVVVCAGLHSDRLAQLGGESAYPKIVPFSGDYYLLTGASAAAARGLIYPVPDPRYPFLGVHITRHIDPSTGSGQGGSTSIGPNAFLAPGREAYDGKLALGDLRDAVGFGGFWRFAARNLWAAARESRSVVSTKSFVAQAQRYLPAIDLADVSPGPRGIRAQAMNADGSLVDDFVITRTRNVVQVRNAPSPGATSSMAIAEHIAAMC